jgi:hypothetical protein
MYRHSTAATSSFCTRSTLALSEHELNAQYRPGELLTSAEISRGPVVLARSCGPVLSAILAAESLASITPSLQVMRVNTLSALQQAVKSSCLSSNRVGGTSRSRAVPRYNLAMTVHDERHNHPDLEGPSIASSSTSFLTPIEIGRRRYGK